MQGVLWGVLASLLVVVVAPPPGATGLLSRDGSIEHERAMMMKQARQIEKQKKLLQQAKEEESHLANQLRSQMRALHHARGELESKQRKELQRRNSTARRYKQDMSRLINRTKSLHSAILRVVDHGRILQFTRDDLAHYPTYTQRGLDQVPATFHPSFKNPCWQVTEATKNIITRDSSPGKSAKTSWHCLPYFMLIGTPKSGTTALYEMIAGHPDVVRTRKEPHWWTRGEESLVDFVTKVRAHTTEN